MCCTATLSSGRTKAATKRLSARILCVLVCVSVCVSQTKACGLRKHDAAYKTTRPLIVISTNTHTRKHSHKHTHALGTNAKGERAQSDVAVGREGGNYTSCVLPLAKTP